MTPQIINTVTGDDGHATSYVSIKEIVDFEGPLVGEPTVSTADSGYISVGGLRASWYGEINGTSYSVGEVITFRTDVVKSADRVNVVDVEFETGSRRQTSSFSIRQMSADPGRVTH